MTALTLYLSNTTSSTVSVGNKLKDTAPSGETNVTENGDLSQGTALGANTWIDCPSKGAAVTTAVTGQPAANGKGWCYDNLDGGVFGTGNWTPTTKIGVSGGADTITGTFHFRLFSRSSGGVYTQRGVDWTVASATYTAGTTTSLAFGAQSITGWTMATGERLYCDLTFNCTAETLDTFPAVHAYMNAGAAEQIVTPGYTGGTVTPDATGGIVLPTIARQAVKRSAVW